MTGGFRFDEGLVSLAVEADETALHRITLGGTAGREPATALEREIARQLTEYFAGRRTAFALPLAPGGSEFERRVWDALCDIPYGRTQSYGDIAAAVGQPGAARAVGMANHRNPIPLVIPCHRVIAADGSLGGFGGGVELKRRLLEHEGALHPSLL